MLSSLRVVKVFEPEWNEEVLLAFPADGEWDKGGNSKDEVRAQMIKQGFHPTLNYTFTNPKLFGFDCEVIGWIWEIDSRAEADLPEEDLFFSEDEMKRNSKEEEEDALMAYQGEW